MEAVVSQVNDSGTALLQAGKMVLRARLEFAVQQGERLSLEVVEAGKQPLLRRLPAKEAPAEPLLRLVRTALPRQEGLVPLLRSLVKVAGHPARESTPTVPPLPEEARRLTARILERIPTPQSLRTGEGVRRHLHDSGLFLEAKLGRSPSSRLIERDLKTQLLRLREALGAGAAAERRGGQPPPSSAGPTTRSPKNPPLPPQAQAHTTTPSAVRPPRPSPTPLSPSPAPVTKARGAGVPESPSPTASASHPSPPTHGEEGKPPLPPAGREGRQGAPVPSRPEGQAPAADRTAPLPRRAEGGGEPPPPSSSPPAKGGATQPGILLRNRPPAVSTPAGEVPARPISPPPPPPPSQGVFPQGRVELPLAVEAQEATERMLRQVEGALARIALSQAASLGGAERPEAGQRPPLILDLPVRTPLGIDLFQLSIREEPGRREAAEEQEGGEEGGRRHWNVTIAFELAGLGPMVARVSLDGDRVSTLFWAERPATVTLVRDHLRALDQGLEAAGLEATHLACREGLPRQEEAAAHRPAEGLLDEEA